MEYEPKHFAAGGGLLAVALLLAGDGFPSDLDEAQERMTDNAESVIDRVVEVSSDGELVVDPLTGVFYDDPEEGPMDDEAGDDANLSFSAVNEALAEVGAYLDPETYAPDVQDGSTAPSAGVISDAGDSQTWGEAGEAEDDDLSERAAESNLSDDEKSMYDRLANVDDVETLDSDQDDEVTESGTHSTVDDSGSSWSSGSSSGSTSTSDDDDDDDHDPYAHLYDDTDPNTGGLVA